MRVNEENKGILVLIICTGGMSSCTGELRLCVCVWVGGEEGELPFDASQHCGQHLTVCFSSGKKKKNVFQFHLENLMIIIASQSI